MKIFDLKEWNKITEETVRTLRSLPEELLQFRPELPDAWTAHEHIMHIAESEVNAFLRLKTILGQSGDETFMIDETAWVTHIDYHKENTEDYLDLFSLVRKIEGNLYHSVIDSSYEKNYVIHKREGKIDVNTWLKWYTDNHLKEHLTYIERNKKLWEESR